MICQHCKQAKVNRPRGLCWSCYYTPGVRDLYPSTSKYARRGVGNFAGQAPLPPFPTAALPGTPEKIAVLEERARLKQSLFHPDDARFENGKIVGGPFPELETTEEPSFTDSDYSNADLVEAA